MTPLVLVAAASVVVQADATPLRCCTRRNRYESPASICQAWSATETGHANTIATNGLVRVIWRSSPKELVPAGNRFRLTDGIGLSIDTGARVRRFATIPAAIFLLAGLCPSNAQVPSGFVYLGDMAPTVRQDIRYAGSHNFVGRRVEGYSANECILSERAARALARVQGELIARNMSLIVWDCYRPRRAVADFLRWSRSPNDTSMKAEFYPRADKSALFALRYLSSRSAHARGSAVDVGIVPGSLHSVPAFDPSAGLKPCTAPKGVRFEDGTLDFGTGYDCLDPRASVGNANVPPEAAANRLLLRRVMQRHGFKPYAREWWHFEYVAEIVPRQSFDFPVVARDRLPAVRPAGITPAPGSR